GQFQRLGLKAPDGESYTQTVPMVQTIPAADATVTLKVGDEATTLAAGDEMVLTTRSEQPTVSVQDSALVFVGYGVNAPEQGWNDYEGVDVTGKTVVMLVNDPGFHVGDESLFGGKRMTYYGRWTYKYEEAARQGAAAALIIHDDEGAGYGWEVVKNSWTGAQFDLPIEIDAEPRVPLAGWLTQAQGQQLFERAGLDLAKLREAANRKDFKAVPLEDASFSATLESKITRGESRNVLALLPGSQSPEEVVIYMAHWDHLGQNPDLEGDQIFNGAIDNATGIAAVLEIAEAFVTQPSPPRRSVLFLAVTLEESGLLGSRYYVNNPVLPLEQTVGVINLDALQVVGETRDLTVIGYGSSELEDVLAKVAQEDGRSLHAEASIEKGFYYRSDHFNFAKAGVPALYPKTGDDHIEKGSEYGLQVSADYIANRYHQPSDEFDPAWDLGGMVKNLGVFHRVGRALADGGEWPNWYEGTEFRAARDAMMAERAERSQGAAAPGG
ncbi:MAG TPA: M28 family metallopeptidase, partial [Xanthomonadaceae bacterium]|nr:M28 family metallopeptidase [Xanthomonadaceae bacterium]